MNLKDTRDAQARGWGAPCHARLVTVEAAGISVPADTRIAELVEAALKEMHKRGYRFHDGWCWGYCCRHILNDPSKPMSNHSWGLALDLDAPTNGYGASTHSLPSKMMREVWNPLGFRWGGDYSGTKDWMHVEFMGTPAEAKELTRKLTDKPKRRRPHQPPAYPGHVLKIGSHGGDVTKIQRALKVKPDGEFGPVTAQAVKQFERGHNIKNPDGIVGQRVWTRIFH